MKLFGLVHAAVNGIAWPTLPNFSFTGSGVTIQYDPESPSGNFVDRFYLGKFTLDESNYSTEGTWLFDVQQVATTVLTLTDLPQNQELFIYGRRLVDGVFTESCLEAFFTTRKQIEVVPSAPVRATNWQTEGFGEWFRIGTEYASAHQLSYRKMSDAVLGNFVRITNEQPGYDNEGVMESTSAYYVVLDGKKHVSSRWNWKAKFKYRIFSDGTYGQGITLGVTSGNQALLAVSAKGSHNAWTNTNPATLPLNTTRDSANNEYIAVCTAHPWAGSLSAWDAHTGWWVRPTSAHVDYSKWQIQSGPDAVNVLRIEYTASDKTVRFYNSEAAAVPFLTLGPDAPNAPGYLKKHLAGDYALPITPIIRIQEFFSQPTTPSPHFDLAEVEMTSDCPYHYAGYVVNPGYHGTYKGVGSGLFQDDDSTLQSLGNFAYFDGGNTPTGMGPSRFTTNLHSGFTAPVVGRPYGSESMFLEGNAFVQGYTYGQTLPVPVPSGKVPKYFAAQGLPRAGTLKVRLLDQDDNILTPWTQVQSVSDTALVEVTSPRATSTEVRMEVEVYYDGSAVTTGFTPYNSQTYLLSDTQMANTSDIIPDTPSLFVGCEVYFDEPGPFTPPAGSYSSAQLVTLTSPTGGTIYYTLDGSDPRIP